MKYTTFIPTHVFDTVQESWIELEGGTNWLDKESDDYSWWIESVKSIVRLDDDYILVIWNEYMKCNYNTSSIYKGILE